MNESDLERLILYCWRAEDKKLFDLLLDVKSMLQKRPDFKVPIMPTLRFTSLGDLSIG